jgi:hypothetical protein
MVETHVEIRPGYPQNLWISSRVSPETPSLCANAPDRPIFKHPVAPWRNRSCRTLPRRVFAEVFGQEIHNARTLGGTSRRFGMTA